MCRRAGLVDGDRKPTITAHRFRHTVGTQLAESGAHLQTIMAILGHRNAQMSVRYSHISDPTLKEQYERVIANWGRVAGPAAEALLNNELDQNTVDWLKNNFFKTELELGHCLRLPADGPCECDLYLHCSKFFTTGKYAPACAPGWHANASSSRTPSSATGPARSSGTRPSPAGSKNSSPNSMSPATTPTNQTNDQANIKLEIIQRR